MPRKLQLCKGICRREGDGEKGQAEGRGSFSVLLWPEPGDASVAAVAAVCSLLIANAEQSLLNGHSCCLSLAFFTNSLTVSVFYRFHIDKRCQHRCSWKCLSIALIFISVVLTAMLAYFAGKHKDQRGVERREAGGGGHLVDMSLSLFLCLSFSPCSVHISPSHCGCVCVWTVLRCHNGERS